jgi:hypothetical protein
MDTRLTSHAIEARVAASMLLSELHDASVVRKAVTLDTFCA